uniref:Uncharacterized protein n=1 Tax=Trichogramma kaykai TaxID=54128 RepID=A0ABD2WY10_9HYME
MPGLRASQARHGNPVWPTPCYTGSQRRRGFALVMEASHAPVMTSMRLDAISSAVPGATEAPDTTAEKRSASSVRAFHLQV